VIDFIDVERDNAQTTTYIQEKDCEPDKRSLRLIRIGGVPPASTIGTQRKSVMKLFKRIIKKAIQSEMRKLAAAELVAISGGTDPGGQVCVVRDNLIVKCPVKS